VVLFDYETVYVLSIAILHEYSGGLLLPANTAQKPRLHFKEKSRNEALYSGFVLGGGRRAAASGQRSALSLL
jgi:hypothetical protein